MNGPYRELPLDLASGIPNVCYVCGRVSCTTGPCHECFAVQEQVPRLDRPVVVTESSCVEGDLIAGAGFVLLHRWWIVAGASSQFLCPSIDAAPSMARERAVGWAHGSTLVESCEQLIDVLDDNYFRTRDLYTCAVRSAKHYAEEGRLRSPSQLRPGVTDTQLARRRTPAEPPDMLRRLLRLLRL